MNINFQIDGPFDVGPRPKTKKRWLKCCFVCATWHIFGLWITCRKYFEALNVLENRSLVIKSRGLVLIHDEKKCLLSYLWTVYDSVEMFVSFLLLPCCCVKFFRGVRQSFACFRLWYFDDVQSASCSCSTTELHKETSERDLNITQYFMPSTWNNQTW